MLIRLLGILSLCYCVAAARNPTEEELLQRFSRGMRSAFDRHPAISTIKQGVAQNNKVDGVIRNIEVQTEKGSIIGQTNAYAHSFFGIPYAEPPKRFEDPVEVEVREQIDASKETSVACFQTADLPNMSEDCLVLNIHVPRTVDDDGSLTTGKFDKRLPVMFWIHGGGFMSGAGTAKVYDARYLSESTNTIVVTINYRLGALGFIVLEETNTDDEITTYGNQGFKDQQLALKWVHENINKFGGDPEQVTIFGESAGAQSVMLHLASTVNDLYFKRAIMESNPAVYQYPTKEQAMQLVDKLVAKLDCGNNNTSSIQCLRNLEPAVIVKAAAKFSMQAFTTFDSQSIVEPFRPYVDGKEFTEQPLAMFEDREKWNNEVDVILGTNRQELGYLNYFFQHIDMPLTEEEFFLLNFVTVGSFKNARKITKEYSKLAPVDHGDNFDFGDIFGQEVGDLYFVCPTRKLARSISKTSASENNYLYSWEHGHCHDPKKICSYSAHGMELAYVFNTANYTQKGEEAVMTKMFSDLWGSFAYEGMPTSADFVEEWPRHIEEPWKSLHMIYPTAQVEVNYMDDLCNFWDELDLYAKVPKKPRMFREEL